MIDRIGGLINSIREVLPEGFSARETTGGERVRGQIVISGNGRVHYLVIYKDETEIAVISKVKSILARMRKG